MAKKDTPTYSLNNETQNYIQEAAKNRRDRQQQLAQEQRGSTNIQSEREITKEINEQVKALKKAKEYSEALLSEKKEILKADAKSLDNQIKELNLLASALKDINAREKVMASISQKEQERDEKLAHAAKMEQELNRAYTENVSLLEKKAAVQEKINKAKKEEKKLQNELAQKIAEVRAGAKEGEDVSSKIKSLKEEYDGRLKKVYSDLGLNSSGGATLKDAFMSGVSDALSSGSVVQGIGSMLNTAFSPILGVLNTIAKFASGINHTLDKGINSSLELQTDYLGKVNSRLQGSNESYQGIVDYLHKNFGTTPFLSQKTALQNIAKLVDTGTTVNLEERGILLTLSDRMVSTFEALNPTLLRLIKIQQADMTASQLGYEGLLTNFFNQQFQDTSYLSAMYDNVMGALVDATSQLDVKSAGAFNYEVQKWLGSLYSVGMSESGISTLAQGINYLATGNVDALNSNEGLRNLFAASAGNAYSSILTGGLNADTVNSLMMSVIEYLRSIATDSNIVTKAARSNIFGGFSLSDIRAVANLSDSQLSTIFGNTAGYSNSIAELTRQLGYVANPYSKEAGTNTRTPLGALFDTALENLLFNFGDDFIKNSSDYTTWRMKSLVANSGIPVISQLAEVSKVLDSIGDALARGSGYADTVMWEGVMPSAEEMKGNAFTNLLSGIADIFRNGGLDLTAQGGSFINLLKGATSFWNFDAPQVRGNAGLYSTIAASNTFKGLSMSEKIGATNSIMGLADTAAATATMNSISGAGKVGDVASLYSELFEKQTTAIKVSLSNIDAQALSSIGTAIANNSRSKVGISGLDEQALEAISSYMHVSKLDSIEDKLSNGSVEVSASSNFVGTIDNGLNYMRGL